MVDVYGIKNCSTVKKALNWLDENQIEYVFHDYKKEGVSAEKIKDWQHEFGWESLINKRGTTWKKLDKQLQESITDGNSAIPVMQENTSVIKRPIIEGNNIHLLGFDVQEYTTKLK